DQSILQRLTQLGSFSSFLTAMKAADLTSILQKKRSYTVLAPDDAAFAKIPRQNLDVLLRDKRRLISILKYHIVERKILADELVKERSIKTLEGDRIIFSRKGDEMFANQAVITKPNLLCKKAVVQGIDELLTPPSR